MPIRWKLFRMLCIVQMLASSVFMIMALIHFVDDGTFYSFISIVLFLLIFLLTILTINILNNNYPDMPVAGKQKSNFNRLFILNFLFLVFLFGILFAEYRELKLVATLTNKTIIDLPFSLFIYGIANLVILLFQFIILYGLYVLRQELYFNFMKKQFEFEKDQV